MNPGNGRLMSLLACGLMMAGAATATAGIQKRSGKREFPAGSCPVHLGRLASDVGADPILRLGGGPGPGTFTATGPRALVSLVSCDSAGRNAFESQISGVNVTVDNFRVVRWDKFRQFQKAYVGEFADPNDPYGTNPATCYADNGGDIFGAQGSIKVKSTFDPVALRAVVKASYKKYVPYEDTFDKGGKLWLLLNASVVEQTPGDKALVLARSSRLDEFGVSVPADQCAVAVIQVTGLTKGFAYVVDFMWNATDFNQAGDLLLNVIVDTTPGKAITTIATPAYRAPSSTNGAQ